MNQLGETGPVLEAVQSPKKIAKFNFKIKFVNIFLFFKIAILRNRQCCERRYFQEIVNFNHKLNNEKFAKTR